MEKRRLWIGLVLLLPVMGLIPMLGSFIYSRGAVFSDLAISHYPNAVWIQHAWQSWKEIPLWSSSILSGYPFFADPLSGLHYPPGWLALLFLQPLGLNLTMALHLLAGGIGMYLFLRTEGLDWLTSLLGALAFEGMPKLIAHLGAGHVTLVYAVSLTPWLFYFQKKNAKRWWLSALWLGLIFLADLRWAAFSLVFWAAYSLKNAHSKEFFVSWVRSAGKIFFAILIAVLLAAVLLIPLFEYTRLSTRSQMTASDALTMSLPPEQLLGLFFPPVGSNQEWVLYPGAVVLILILAGLFDREYRRRAGFWLIFALAGILYSLGSYLPGMEWLARLPSFDLLRVPPRALFLSGFSLAVCAAISLDLLIQKSGLSKDRSARFLSPVLAGLNLCLVLLAGLGWVVTRQFPLRFAWGAAAFTMGFILLVFFRSGKMKPFAFGFAASILLLVDLCGSNLSGLEARPVGRVLSEGQSAAVVIQGQAGPTRVYSPSYSIPQQTAMNMGLELADGVDPLQLHSYVNFMQKASGVPASGYSVTLPPFKLGNTRDDNRDAIPDARLLGLLNVGYIASEFDLKADGLVQLSSAGNTRIYWNQYVLPRAWVQDPEAAIGQGTIRPATLLVKTANTLQIEARGPGLLVLSEIDYPGWEARVDGSSAEMKPVDGLLRGLILPAGTHTVQMQFHPASLVSGGLVSLISWLGLAASCFLPLRRKTA